MLRKARIHGVNLPPSLIEIYSWRDGPNPYNDDALPEHDAFSYGDIFILLQFESVIAQSAGLVEYARALPHLARAAGKICPFLWDGNTAFIGLDAEDIVYYLEFEDPDSPREFCHIDEFLKSVIEGWKNHETVIDNYL
jgi:hypothetical protein